MEKCMEKICPILTAGAFADSDNKNGDPVPCWEELCQLWDEDNEICSLRTHIEMRKAEYEN